MLHSNILRTIEKMSFKEDIEDEKKQHNTFEKVVGVQIPMLLDEGIMVVHIGLNPSGFKHEHFGTRV